MHNWLKYRLDDLILGLEKDLELISKKKKPDEWKRDHYRYTFAVSAQRIFTLLNISITAESVSPIKDSTKKELIILKDMIDEMLIKHKR